MTTFHERLLSNNDTSVSGVAPNIIYDENIRKGDPVFFCGIDEARQDSEKTTIMFVDNSTNVLFFGKYAQYHIDIIKKILRKYRKPLLRIKPMLSFITPITCTFKPVKW
jgi:hypothetical protein